MYINPQKWSSAQGWLLTSEGYVKFYSRVYNQNEYCMDDKMELNHNFYLFLCFEKHSKEQIWLSSFKVYAIFIFFKCRMYYLITV